MKNTFTYLVALVFVCLTACTGNARLASPQNTGDTREAVLQADRDFSKMSEEKGLNTAFIAFAATDATLLRAQSQPISGRDNIRMYVARTSDENSRLTWSPVTAEIAVSGELAYTYGTYLLESRDLDGKIITTDGTYVTVWRKDEKGFWKYVLHSGNAGLRP